MPNLSQHEAAELWEITRDHHVSAAKLQLFSQFVTDQQLRSLVQRQVQHSQQAAQRLESIVQGGGGIGHAHVQGHINSAFQTQPNQSWAVGGQQSGSQQWGGITQGVQLQPLDAMVAGELLANCKAMSVKCIWSATEASQPARNFLQQLSGDHLRSAEEAYHWMDQRGIYASPKADQQAVQTYSQGLQRISSLGQQVGQMARQIPQQIGQTAQTHHQGAQQHQQHQPQPAQHQFQPHHQH